MDVVLYMRYSSDRQTEQSIEGQDRVCSEFCKREGYNIVYKYIDRATSAFKDTDKRLEFNRMIKDSEKHQFEAVIVYKLDRFARNRYDAATCKAKLKKNGVRVISATEQISDSPEGVILEAVLEGMAEFYSMELSQKITRGMEESAHKANSVGGVVPLGYKIEGKKYVVDEVTAPIVKEAFERYAAGETVTEICTLFNSRGYRTATKKRFNKNSFNRMFRNERYIGVYKYKDIRIEGGVPQIIDKATFEKVQRMLKQNGEAPARGKAKTEYLLAQKIFCGHCGAPMLGECGRSATGRVYHYYSCGNRKKHGSCNKKPLQKEWIELEVVKEAMKLLTPERIEELADMAVKQNREDIENNKAIPAIRAEIKDIETRYKNLFKLAEMGSQSDMLFERLKELEDQKNDAEKRLKYEMSQFIVLDKEMVLWWLNKFTDGDYEDPKYRKFIIDMFINSVTVWDDPDGYKITTVYNLSKDRSRTVRLSGCGSSDLSNHCPPLQYNPNTIIVYDSFLIYTFISYVK